MINLLTEGVASCFCIGLWVGVYQGYRGHMPKVVSQTMGDMPCLQGGPHSSGYTMTDSGRELYELYSFGLR